MRNIEKSFHAMSTLNVNGSTNTDYFPKPAAGAVAAAPRPVPTIIFEPFLRFPFDIRAQIWEWALPGPRLVTVFVYKDIMFGEYISVKILFVSCESRDIALRHYQLCFGVGRLERWLPSTITSTSRSIRCILGLIRLALEIQRPVILLRPSTIKFLAM